VKERSKRSGVSSSGKFKLGAADANCPGREPRSGEFTAARSDAAQILVRWNRYGSSSPRNRTATPAAAPKTTTAAPASMNRRAFGESPPHVTAKSVPTPATSPTAAPREPVTKIPASARATAMPWTQRTRIGALFEEIDPARNSAAPASQAAR